MRTLVAVLITIGMILLTYWAVPNLLSWVRDGDSMLWGLVKMFPAFFLSLLLVMLSYGLAVGALKPWDHLAFRIYIWTGIFFSAFLLLWALTGPGWKIKGGIALLLIIRGLYVLSKGFDAAYKLRGEK